MVECLDLKWLEMGLRVLELANHWPCCTSGGRFRSPAAMRALARVGLIKARAAQPTAPDFAQENRGQPLEAPSTLISF
ncbi:hypothetical protein BDZ45DRAFT_670904 [Acephala macrosclerotiorum]|nr:hypothetical protein BDZ45DRAFT_670904 [Acephala macrosclerotiorum]